MRLPNRIGVGLRIFSLLNAEKDCQIEYALDLEYFFC